MNRFVVRTMHASRLPVCESSAHCKLEKTRANREKTSSEKKQSHNTKMLRVAQIMTGAVSKGTLKSDERTQTVLGLHSNLIYFILVYFFYFYF